MGLITSVVLTRKLQIDWLKVTHLGDAEAVTGVGIRSRFGDMELSTSDSILGLLSLFKQR